VRRKRWPGGVNRAVMITKWTNTNHEREPLRFAILACLKSHPPLDAASSSFSLLDFGTVTF
jgi:hypothetical protein